MFSYVFVSLFQHYYKHSGQRGKRHLRLNKITIYECFFITFFWHTYLKLGAGIAQCYSVGLWAG
jgi:hypothetical protein